MKYVLSVMSAFLMVFLLAGCLETEREFLINPDGTGKVTIEATVTRLDRMFEIEDGKKRKPEQELADFVATIIGESEGIDLWSDVSYKNLPEDKIYFKGTAYFRDLDQLKFKNLSNSSYQLERLSNGNFALRLKEENSDEGSTDPPPSLTEEEIAVKIDSLRTNFQMGRQMMEPMLKGMRDRNTFRFSGDIQQIHGFERAPSGGGVVLEISGEKILQTMDSVTALDSFWRTQVVSGGKDMSGETFFGGKQPEVVFAQESKPLFNYDKEVAAARKKYAALRKKLKIQ